MHVILKGNKVFTQEEWTTGLINQKQTNLGFKIENTRTCSI